MLTHMFRRSFYANWAVSWLEQNPKLPEYPSGVSVDEHGSLLMEFANDDSKDDEQWLWSPGELMNQLQISAPTAQTVCCCWHLCRHYDDQQETSNMVTAKLAKRLRAEIAPSAWYWSDQHDVLVTTTNIVGKPKNLSAVQIEQTEEDAHSVVFRPCKGLHSILSSYLKYRAFPTEKKQEQKS